jgi:hypothetical protein
VTRCPQCLADSLVQDVVCLLHLRCRACGCVVVPSSGGPLFGCETCGRKACQFRAAGVGVAHCKRWKSKVRRVEVEDPDLFA